MAGDVSAHGRERITIVHEGATPLLFAADSGGSKTLVRIRSSAGDARLTFASTNPASASDEQVDATWSAVFAAVAQPGIAVRGWVAAAAVMAATVDAETARLGRVARMHGLAGEVVVTNDVTPLLLMDPCEGPRLVLIAGTGSCVFGFADGGPIVQAGGYEYIASDEGSGFDIGMKGIRAATRAHDGRGERTALTAMLERHFGAPVPQVGRRLGLAGRPKPLVAAFAPAVFTAWLAGDAVAAAIIEDAVLDLTAACVAVARMLGRADGWDLVLVGGVATGSAPFTERLVDAIGRRVGLTGWRCVADVALVALELLASGADHARLGGPTGLVRLEAGQGLGA